MYQLLKRQRRFKERDAVFYAAEVVLALEYLHTKLQVVYRDLKPQNILLDFNGHIKLTDFGLSTDAKWSKSFCGTPHYLSPEIIKGNQYDKSVDLWCLGILIYQILYGKPPFKDHNRKNIFKKILVGKFKFDNRFKVSKAAKDIIRKLLQQVPEKRLGYRNFNEIK